MTKQFSRMVSNTGKLSGVNAPMPPEGSFLNCGRVPEKRSWQCASADTHISANSAPTTNSGEAGP